LFKKKQKISFSLDVNSIALKRRKFDSDEIGRGIGVQKTKKGKGSYTRKEKYKKNYSEGNYGSFFFSAM